MPGLPIDALSVRRVTPIMGEIEPYYSIEGTDGSILRVPVAEVHPEERVFFEDAEIRASIQRGMRDYANGALVDCPDFFLDSDE